MGRDAEETETTDQYVFLSSSGWYLLMGGKPPTRLGLEQCYWHNKIVLYSVQSNQIINNLSLLAFILISLIVDSISHPLYGDPKMRHFHLHCSTTPTSRIMTGIETPYYYCMHDH